MDLILATNNAHKVGEFNALFHPWVIQIPASAGLPHWNHDETADTFLGNALGKARSLWEALGGQRPVLADDSGLCIDALGGAPGVYSARYGEKETGRPLRDSEKNSLVLSQLEGQVRRSARFVCSLALVLAPHRVYVIEESWEGTIALSLGGEHGFGYDPLFIPVGETKTSAELEPEVKNQLSHRGRASRRLLALLHHLEHEKEGL